MKKRCLGFEGLCCNQTGRGWNSLCSFQRRLCRYTYFKLRFARSVCKRFKIFEEILNIDIEIILVVYVLVGTNSQARIFTMMNF